MFMKKTRNMFCFLKKKKIASTTAVKQFYQSAMRANRNHYSKNTEGRKCFRKHCFMGSRLTRPKFAVLLSLLPILYKQCRRLSYAR